MAEKNVVRVYAILVRWIFPMVLLEPRFTLPLEHVSGLGHYLSLDILRLERIVVGFVVVGLERRLVLASPVFPVRKIALV